VSERLNDVASIAALLGDEGPGRASTCAWCRCPVHLSQATIEIAKSWNRLQARIAERGERAEAPLQYGELALCDACFQRRRDHLELEGIREHETMRFYLQQLRDFSYTQESLLWLRTHGCGDHVEEALRREKQTPEKRAQGRKAA
jgi:hypothetical protein